MPKMKLRAGARHMMFDEKAGEHRLLKAGEEVELTDEQVIAIGDKFEEVKAPPMGESMTCPECGARFSTATGRATNTSGLAQDAGAKTQLHRETSEGVPGAQRVDAATIDRFTPGMRAYGEIPAGSGEPTVKEGEEAEGGAGGAQEGSPQKSSGSESSSKTESKAEGNDPSDGTVDEVKARIAKMNSKAELNALARAEEKNRNRTGVLDAIDRRKAQLDNE